MEPSLGESAALEGGRDYPKRPPRERFDFAWWILLSKPDT